MCACVCAFSFLLAFINRSFQPSYPQFFMVHYLITKAHKILVRRPPKRRWVGTHSSGKSGYLPTLIYLPLSILMFAAVLVALLYYRADVTSRRLLDNRRTHCITQHISMRSSGRHGIIPEARGGESRRVHPNRHSWESLRVREYHYCQTVCTLAELQ